MFVGVAPTPEVAEAVARDAARQRCYDAASWERLATLRATIDPGGRMAAAVPVADAPGLRRAAEPS